MDAASAYLDAMAAPCGAPRPSPGGAPAGRRGCTTPVGDREVVCVLGDPSSLPEGRFRSYLLFKGRSWSVAPAPAPRAVAAHVRAAGLHGLAVEFGRDLAAGGDAVCAYVDARTDGQVADAVADVLALVEPGIEDVVKVVLDALRLVCGLRRA